MGYNSPENTPFMKRYRARMRECIRLEDCVPVPPSQFVDDEILVSSMGARGGGGGRGGSGRGGSGRSGFSRGGSRHGVFRRGGFRRGGYPWAVAVYDGGYYVTPCDLDPLSYECFLFTRGASAVMGEDVSVYPTKNLNTLRARMLDLFNSGRVKEAFRIHDALPFVIEQEIIDWKSLARAMEQMRRDGNCMRLNARQFEMSGCHDNVSGNGAAYYSYVQAKRFFPRLF